MKINSCALHKVVSFRFLCIEHYFLKNMCLCQINKFTSSQIFSYWSIRKELSLLLFKFYFPLFLAENVYKSSPLLCAQTHLQCSPTNFLVAPSMSLDSKNLKGVTRAKHDYLLVPLCKFHFLHWYYLILGFRWVWLIISLIIWLLFFLIYFSVSF